MKSYVNELWYDSGSLAIGVVLRKASKTYESRGYTSLNIFIIQCREKWSKQNMKKIFRENVFICEDFSLNRKENELRSKYGIFGGSTEKNKDPPILEIEQNRWFHWI